MFSKNGDSYKKDNYKKKNRRSQWEDRVHRAAWDSDLETSSTSLLDLKPEDCNTALLASVTSDTNHDEVNLSTLPRSQLIEIIEGLNKKVGM